MSTSFGAIIKRWRGVRRFSQLALSHEAGLSARHLSFLETGRSRPGRDAVLKLARAMDMPQGAVNDALLAAGFAPEFCALDPSDIDLAPMMAAMMTILENHAPMPAIILDGGWNIVGGNTPAMRMVDILPFHGSLNVVEALLNDDRSAPVFINWAQIADWTYIRLQAEVAKAGPGSPLIALRDRLATDIRLAGYTPDHSAPTGPVLTLQVKAGDVVLSLFTMLAEFTTAQDVTMSERRVELFFAADAQTKAFFVDGKMVN